MSLFTRRQSLNFHPFVPFSAQGGKLRTSLLILSGLLATAALLCFSNILLAEQKIPKTQLRLWHSWKAEERTTLESITTDFNCRHEGVEVSAEMSLGPGASLSERILSYSTAEALPDLAIVEREEIPALVEAGKIRSFDALSRSAETPSNVVKEQILLPAARAYGTYRGNLYGLPVRLNPFVLISNTILCAASNVSSSPDDWNDLIELARFLGENRTRGADSAPWVLSVRTAGPLFHILCVQRGVDLFAPKSAAENAAAIEEILKFIHSLREPAGLLPPQYKFWDPNFIGVTGGKALFQIDDSAMLAHLVESSNAPLAVSPVPSDSPVHRTYLSRSPVFVLLSRGENAEAVLKFIDFFYSPEGYSRFAKLLFVSPFKNSVPAGVAPNDEIYSQLCQAAQNADTHSLREDSGKILPCIARIVEQLDAGLISVREASTDILKSIEDKKNPPLATGQVPLDITWAESTRRLTRETGADFLSGPVQIVSARNEHEAFQLALSAEQPLYDVEVVMPVFVSQSGPISAIKTATYLEEDTSISTPLVAQEPGPYPNILRPQNIFDIPPHGLTRLWIDVFVRDDVPEGEYSSTITIRQHNIELARLPIQLRVLSARIPPTPSQPAAIGLNYELIARRYGLQKDSEKYRRLMDAYYWFMVEHRLSPYDPPVPIDSPEAEHYLKDERVSVARIPFHPRDQRFQKATILAKEGGWLDKLYSYFIDEPTYHQYKSVIATAERIHSLPASPKFMVTCFPDDLLAGAVDIWGVHMGFLPEGIPHGPMDRRLYVDAVNSRRTGGQVWWYTAGAVRPFPSLQIEDDPAAFRIIPWMQQLYRIDGFLQWEAANWIQPPDQPFIPFFGNGEGILVYPGDMNPAPSIRLELLREGLEDMEHLILLRRSIADVQAKLNAGQLGDVSSVRVSEICRRLISDEGVQAHALLHTLLLPYFVRSPGMIEKVRLEVIGEAIELGGRPLALVLTEPEEKRYTDSNNVRIFGVVEPGCQVTIEGAGVAVDQAGRFSAQFPLVSGSNTFRILLENGDTKKIVSRKISRF